MEREIQMQQLAPGVEFIGITDKKRKTNRITAAMLLPLDTTSVSSNAIVPFLLKRSCSEYPDFTALNEKLALLYGAVPRAGVTKLGENQLLSLTISALDDKFALADEKLTQQCAQLLISMLFSPALENENFRSKDTEIEKRQMKERIEAEINDKRAYAKKRALEIMCQNETFGINPLGTSREVTNLTAEQITGAWKNILNTARFIIMVTGPADPSPIIRDFQKKIEGINRSFKPLRETEIILETDEVKEKTERVEAQQAKLVLCFRSGIAEPDKAVSAARLMAALFGGTPHSRLFLNVREKLSLCYYCAAKYDANKGIMTVECGLEEQNAEKAKEEILHQLDFIKNNEFTENELVATKMSVVNAVLSARDSLGELEAWYLRQVLDNSMDTPEERIAKIEQVSREEVVNAANKVVLDTVYLLTGKESAE